MDKPFFTLEDAKIAFNLFCCVYGIGTLGMPANFSRAGPPIAIAALLFMAIANVYASVACSKVLLVAPRSVQTFGDLGEWCMGKPGRCLVVVSQMGVCLLVPCAFLVLGGTLLDGLFPGAFSPTTWIIGMALMVLPVCLIPTLKEGAGIAFAGCLGTILADIIGVGVLLHGMHGHPTVPPPAIAFEQVATAFGNLSLAYGAGIVIPALQRQHSDPTRMPRVVCVTLSVISLLFLALAGAGYSAVGCQLAGNLLFSIYPDATTGVSKLGFASDRGAVVAAYLFMQLHITIAFAVLIAPAFYLAERLVLGMHTATAGTTGGHDFVDNDGGDAFAFVVDTPAAMLKSVASKSSVVSFADLERAADPHTIASAYAGANALRYVALRVTIVAALVGLSVLLQRHFLELSDLIGASCITLSCLVLPIAFYLKQRWRVLPLYEKAFALAVVLVCLVLGAYVTYISGKALFWPLAAADPSIRFPFCAPEHQRELYWQHIA